MEKKELDLKATRVSINGIVNSIEIHRERLIDVISEHVKGGNSIECETYVPSNVTSDTINEISSLYPDNPEYYNIALGIFYDDEIDEVILKYKYRDDYDFINEIDTDTLTHYANLI